MSERAFVGACSDWNTVADSTTYYGAFGGYAATGQNVVESRAQLRIAEACTVKNLRVHVNQNNRSVGAQLALRQNGADTTLVAPITANATGTFSDTTDSVALAANDLWNYALAMNSGTGTTFQTAGISAEIETPGQIFTQQSAFGSLTTTVSRVLGFAGALANTGTANIVALTALESATLSNLQIIVSANASTGFTVKSRKNAADGAQIVTVTSGVGRFEDTTHTDSLVAGDTYYALSSTPSGSVTFSACSINYMSAVANRAPVATGPNNTSLPSGATRFSGMFGTSISSTTEAAVQTPAPFNATLSKLSAYVTANTSTIGATLALRKSAVSGNQSVPIAASTTNSLFEDTTNSDSVLAGELLSTMANGSNGAIDIRFTGMLVTAAAVGNGNRSNLLLTGAA